MKSARVAFALALAGCGRSSPAVEPPGAAEKAPLPTPVLRLRFEDVTHASGVEFTHRTGASGQKLLPETMGAGACLFHADGDGVLDLFLVDGGALPGASEAQGSAGCRLYRGLGQGRFADVSASSGVDAVAYGMGAIAADHDGDGDQDLYLTTLGDDLLLENAEGSFRDVGRRAGVGRGRWVDRSGETHAEWTTAALWFDADGDDDLELFVGGYVQWTPRMEIFTSLDGVTKAFTTPERYPGLPCRLYRNEGDGTYSEAAFGEGWPDAGKVLGAALWDFDGDGRLEVVAANDTRPNFYFADRGDGVLEEIGVRVGMAYDENGRARAGMGIDVAEPEPGRPVVAIGNFADEPLSLYERIEDGSFRLRGARSGLQEATYRPLSFGLAFLDLDLDGWLDLVVVNGHIEPQIARWRQGQSHAQSPSLFRGLPDGRFADASAEVGADFARPLVGRGLAWGDLDGDGDLDLVITQNGGPAVVLRNRIQEESPRHFLRVDLRGAGANTAAIGARIELEAAGRVQVRTVRTGSSYLSQGELTATFGLGATTRVERLKVRWPGGATSEHPYPPVDRTLLLRHP